jgi:3-oxoacyl-[acyl-carrier protein] reductase
MTPPLTGKVALVTGGSRGIGAAIVRRLAADGASVAFTYSSAETQANALVAEIVAEGGRAAAILADSADPKAVRNAVEATVAGFGGLDILVNNAGILTLGRVEAIDLDLLDRTYAINVRAPFVATQAAAEHLGDGGRVIMIGSMVGDVAGGPGISVYALSKAAIAAMTRGLAQDLGPRGITVNNVQPGPTNTDMNPADGPAADGLRARIPVGRLGKPEEIANLVAFLAGPQSGYVNGASLTVDGGFTA